MGGGMVASPVAISGLTGATFGGVVESPVGSVSLGYVEQNIPNLSPNSVALRLTELIEIEIGPPAATKLPSPISPGGGVATNCTPASGTGFGRVTSKAMSSSPKDPG